MSETSLRDDLKEIAREVRSWPAYMRTSSSASKASSTGKTIYSPNGKANGSLAVSRRSTTA
jgi:hypothetical protein